MKRLLIGGAGLLFATAASAQVLTDGVPPPPAGKAQIVFFRATKRNPVSCAVHENGAKLTSLPPHHFAVVPLSIGTHRLVVKSEASSAITINAEPDKTYYAECTVGAGFIVERPHLHASNREAFMAMLPELKPVGEEGRE